MILSRFRFRLRSLFVVVTAVAVVLAAGGYVHQRLSGQSRAIDEIKRAADAENARLDETQECSAYPRSGVSVTTRPRRLLGVDLSRLRPGYVEATRLSIVGEAPVRLAAEKLGRFPQLHSLRLESFSLADRQLQPVSRLAHLEELEVRSDLVDGSFLSQFPADSRLAKLSLRSERLGDEALISVCRLPAVTHFEVMGLRLKNPQTMCEIKRLRALQSLCLSGDFSLREVAVLAELPELRALDLCPGKQGIDDNAFGHLCCCEAVCDLVLCDLNLQRPGTVRELARMPRLFTLSLYGHFPEEGLDVLATLEELDFATLHSPTLTNDGVRRVAKSPTIYSLTIISQQVDDGVLDDLAGMPALRRLWLRDTKVTAEGIARLRAKRPDIDMYD